MTIRVIQGDSRAIMRDVADGSVKCVVSSPPYNIGKSYETRTGMDAYLYGLVAPVLVECVRSLADGGSLCWQVGHHVSGTGRARSVLPLDFVYAPMIREMGLTLRGRAIWHFGHGLHNTHSFSGRHETVLWFTRGRPTFDVAAASRAINDVWEITNVKHNHPEKTSHPCQYPEELVRRLLEVLTVPGDLIVDPFAGVGATGKVAKRMGRDGLLIELDPVYAKIAERRIEGTFL